MRKLFEDKRVVFSVAILALLSLVLLAGSLQGMDFRPGEATGRPNAANSEGALNLEQMITTAAEVPPLQQLAFWASLFIVVVLCASLLNPELRKKLILAFIRLALFVLVFLYIFENNPEMFAGFFSQLELANDLTAESQPEIPPLPVFEPPQVSNWFSYLVALGIVVLAGISFWWLARLWTRIRQSTSGRASLDELAAIARRSLDELKSGGHFENAILECYARMSMVVGKRKGLHREQAMTPAEFSARLTRAGLPREPVERLTGLFEAVRYGRQPAGDVQVNEAITSLGSILRYCGEDA
jgi:hypothetical protein